MVEYLGLRHPASFVKIYKSCCSCFQRQLVQLVVDGLDLLIKMEKKLRAGESIDDMIPAGAK